jgi:hypothetical protein
VVEVVAVIVGVELQVVQAVQVVVEMVVMQLQPLLLEVMAQITQVVVLVEAVGMHQRQQLVATAAPVS